MAQQQQPQQGSMKRHSFTSVKVSQGGGKQNKVHAHSRQHVPGGGRKLKGPTADEQLLVLSAQHDELLQDRRAIGGIARGLRQELGEERQRRQAAEEHVQRLEAALTDSQACAAAHHALAASRGRKAAVLSSALSASAAEVVVLKRALASSKVSCASAEADARSKEEQLRSVGAAVDTAPRVCGDMVARLASTGNSLRAAQTENSWVNVQLFQAQQQVESVKEAAARDAADSKQQAAAMQGQLTEMRAELEAVRARAASVQESVECAGRMAARTILDQREAAEAQARRLAGLHAELCVLHAEAAELRALKTDAELLAELAEGRLTGERMEAAYKLSVAQQQARGFKAGQEQAQQQVWLLTSLNEHRMRGHEAAEARIKVLMQQLKQAEGAAAAADPRLRLRQAEAKQEVQAVQAALAASRSEVAAQQASLDAVQQQLADSKAATAALSCKLASCIAELQRARCEVASSQAELHQRQSEVGKLQRAAAAVAAAGANATTWQAARVKALTRSLEAATRSKAQLEAAMCAAGAVSASLECRVRALGLQHELDSSLAAQALAAANSRAAAAEEAALGWACAAAAAALRGGEAQPEDGGAARAVLASEPLPAVADGVVWVEIGSVAQAADAASKAVDSTSGRKWAARLRKSLTRSLQRAKSFGAAMADVVVR